MNQIGIIIPTYKRQKELLKTLNVILQGSKLPIYICLNKDPQNTAVILDDLKNAFPGRITYEINKNNIGMSANFFKVASENPFKLSIFYCDDDIPNLNYLNEIIDSFKKGDQCIYLSDRNVPEKFKKNIFISSWFASQALPGLTANTSLFKKYFPRNYSKGLYPQIEFSLKAIKNGVKVHFIKEDPCLKYAKISTENRISEQSRTSDYNFSERLLNLSKYISKRNFRRVITEEYSREIAWTYAQLNFIDLLKAFKTLNKNTSGIIPFYLFILIFLKIFYYHLKLYKNKN